MTQQDIILENLMTSLPESTLQDYKSLPLKKRKLLCRQMLELVLRYHPEYFTQKPTVASGGLSLPHLNPQASLLKDNSLSRGGGWIVPNRTLKLEMVSGRESWTAMACFLWICGGIASFALYHNVILALGCLGAGILTFKKLAGLDDCIVADLASRRFYTIKSDKKSQTVLPQLRFNDLICLSVDSKYVKNKNGTTWSYWVSAIGKDNRGMKLSESGSFEDAMEYCACLCKELDLPFNKNIESESLLNRSRLQPIKL